MTHIYAKSVKAKQSVNAVLSNFNRSKLIGFKRLFSIILLSACCVLFSLLFSFCKNETAGTKRNIKSYYYPFEKLQEEGLVYAFDAQNLANGIKNTEYWYVRSIKTDTGYYVTSTYYDPTLTIGLISVDRVVGNGVLLDKIFFFDRDTLTGQQVQLPGIIDAGNSFPFEVGDSTGLFLYSVKYHPLGDSNSSNYLIRNKRFFGNGIDFDFKGQKLETIEFRHREVAGNDGVGAAELEGHGRQFYAKNLGLVYYQKHYKGYEQEYALVDTFSMDVFLERARAKMTQ